MDKFIIGGWVRDKLLGRNPSDKDFVVVGSTTEEMIKLGFKPVGKEFPVFLDKTGNEYALARTERKTGNKHTDFEFIFTPDTTLEEDVLRRDLTINSLAIRTEDSGFNNIRDKVIDYVGGLSDLDNHILRAVRPETFIEDSLRVLRLYRFQAQLSDTIEFTIDPTTEELCRKMVADGMLEHLTPERIWKEIEKALGEGCRSDLFFKGLYRIGALKVILPEIDRLFNTPEKLEFHPSGNSGDHTMIALARVQDCNPTVKFAVLLHDIGKGTTPPEILPAHHDHDIRGLPLIEEICDRLRVPNYYRKEALTFCKAHMRIIKIHTMSLKKQYDLISELSDGFKDSILLSHMQLCFMADFYGEIQIANYPEDDELYHSTISRMNDIYNILYGVNVERLPEEDRNSLARFNGVKFGQLLRDYKIKYLRNKLSKR